MSHSIRSLLFAEGQTLLRAHRADDAAAAFERALREAGDSPSTAAIVVALAGAYGATKPEYALRILLNHAAFDVTEQQRLVSRAGDILNPIAAVLVAPLLDSEWQWLLREAPEHTLVARLLFAADVYVAAQLQEKAFDVLTRVPRLAIDNLQRQGIVQRLYEIARRLNSSNDLMRSQDVLRYAIDLSPDHLASRWLLAEVLRRRSYPDNSPELRERGQTVGEADINDALHVWAEAAVKSEVIESWALASRALFSEQLGKLPQADTWALGWEAVVYALRAMFSRGFDYVEDSLTLGRCFRALELKACERTLINRAVELATSPEDKRSATEDLLITVTNAGEFHRSLALIDELGQAAWTDAVKAFVRVRQGAPEEALELIERAMAGGFREPWCVEVQNLCYQEAGDRERFFQSCEATWAETGTDDETLLRRGRAGLFLALRSGDFTGAEKAVAEYVSRPSMPTDESRPRLSLLLAVARRDAQAVTTHLERSLSRTTSRELEDFQRDVRFMEKLSPAAAPGDTSVFTRVDQWLRAHIAARAFNTPDPARELEALLRTRPETDANGWLFAGARGTRGQLTAWNGHFESAANDYMAVLGRSSDKLPEARQALDECAKQLLAGAEAGLADDATADQRSSAIRNCEWLTQQPPVSNSIRGHAWTALLFAHATDGATERAQLAYEGALEAFKQSPSLTSPASSISARLNTLIQRARDYWRIWDAMVKVLPMAFDRKNLEEGLLTWFGTAYSAQPRREDLEWLPIIVELGSGLIPEDAERDYQSWALFKTYIPELREWIVAQYGVKVGSIRVRGNTSLSEAQYAFLIEEVPVPLGQNIVRLGASFVTASRQSLLKAGVAEQDIEDVRHPLTGKTSFWVASRSQAALDAARLPTQEPLQFILEHLRQVLCRHLHVWVGPDMVDASVSEHCKTPEQQALANEVLPTTAARLQFSRVLRALVREGVSMGDVPEILDAVRQVPISTARDAAIKAVRLQLRSRLPGNHGHWHRVAVPPDLEHAILEAIQNPDDGVAATRVATEVAALLSGIARDEVETFDGIALTTTQYESAAYLRTVIQHDPWRVTALCQQEVYEPVAAAVTTV